MKDDTRFVVHLCFTRPKAIPFNLLSNFINVVYISNCFWETDTDIFTSVMTCTSYRRSDIVRTHQITVLKRSLKFDCLVTIWYLICEVANQWKDQDTTVVHYLCLLLAVIQELQALYQADQQHLHVYCHRSTWCTYWPTTSILLIILQLFCFIIWRIFVYTQ